MKAKTEPEIKSEPLQDGNPRSAMWPTYAPPIDLVFSHGKGTELFTDRGDRYLDFISGIAVTSFGHAHPRLVEAVSQQAEKLWHISNMFRIPKAEAVAKRLVENSFADAVFFTNSGTESVEAGLKAIRGFQAGIGQAHKHRIIGFSGSFHGRSIAAVASAGNPDHCKPFISSDYGFDQVPWGDIAAVEQAIGPETAGIILEPIQGEGGVRPSSDEFLVALRQLCDEHGLLLMFDEVQCGAGRSGKLFAHQLTPVAPDIMSLAKGLGGGFPVGACLATQKVADHMVVGTHGTTYGGNPMAAAVAECVLDMLLEPELLPSVTKKGQYFMSKLKALSEAHPRVFNGVRGRGLMVGMACTVTNTDVLLAARERGLLLGKAGFNMLRLMPPLNVSYSELDEAVQVLDDIASQLTQ